MTTSDPYGPPTKLAKGVPPVPTKTEHLTNLCREWATREAHLKTLREQLAREEQQFRELITIEIPDAMDDAEVETHPLPNGTVLKLTTEYIPQIKVAEEEAAFQWIREQGFADKLKNTVTVDFYMEEDELAERFRQFCRKHFAERMTSRTYLHSSTERAWAREVTEKGLSLPPEISIFALRKATIVKPKGAGKKTPADRTTGTKD